MDRGLFRHKPGAEPRTGRYPGKRKITRTLQHHELVLEKRYLFKEGMLFYITPDVLLSL